MDMFFCNFLKQEHENKEIFVQCNGQSYTGMARSISQGKIYLDQSGTETVLETKEVESIRNIQRLLSRPQTGIKNNHNPHQDQQSKSEQVKRRPQVKSILKK